VKIKLLKPWGGNGAGMVIDPMPSLAQHLVDVEYATYVECPACPLIETGAVTPTERAVIPAPTPKKRGRPKKPADESKDEANGEGAEAP